MQVFNLNYRLKLCALAVAVSLGLSACTSTTPDSSANAVTTTQAFSSLTQSTAQYQELLDNADQDSRFPAMILVARSAIMAKDFDTATGLISTMQKEAITPLQIDQAAIIEGLLFLHQKKTTDAIFSLNKVNATQLPIAVASFYYQVISNAEFNLYSESNNTEHLLRSVKHKITLLNYLNPKAQETICLQIVKNLEQLNASNLTVLLNQESDPIMQGFIDFALLDSSKSNAVKQQLSKDWLKKYKKHPASFAAEQLVQGQNMEAGSNANDLGELSSANIVSLKEGEKLAVLLPLTGRFAASVGEPARLGILAALQDRNSKLKVTFYDTNRMTMEEIASALAQNGTNFIIGPILKPEVDALMATKIKLPTIVFNQPASEKENFFYFDLGPDYEGALAAAKIHYDGYNRPIVVAPESTRGQRAIAGFNKAWQNTNKKAPVVCRYADINNAASALTTCPLATADSIYVNAAASDVIKLRSTLPSQTPLYLTNRSNMGINHSSAEMALSGANLGDMPWLLTDSNLKKDLMATLPKADAQIQRIFATAYDSINLSFNLSRLSQDQSDVLHGISGDLQLSKGGLIEMAPMWVKLGANRPVN